MTKLNYQEILEKLKEKIKNVERFAHEDYVQNLGEELGEDGDKYRKCSTCCDCGWGINWH